MKKKKAFTMVELVFVIVVLGILAAISIPRLGATKQDAEVTTSIANMHTLINDVSAYYAVRGNFQAKANLWHYLVADAGAFDTIPAGADTKADTAKDVSYIPWTTVTNVPLYNDNGQRISSNDTVENFVYLRVNNENCISTAVSGNVLLFKSVGNSAACNAVKTEDSIARVINNKLINIDTGEQLVLNDIDGAVVLGGNSYVLVDVKAPDNNDTDGSTSTDNNTTTDNNSTSVESGGNTSASNGNSQSSNQQQQQEPAKDNSAIGIVSILVGVFAAIMILSLLLFFLF